MNKIHRKVWNQHRGAFMVVAESAPSRGKRSGTSGALLASVLVAAVAAGPALAAGPAPNTLPVGAQVTAGQAQVGHSGNTLTVTQDSQRAAINWQSFSIGADAAVSFVQPNAAAVALNRVTGREGSVIDGALQANGQVFILNPNGVLFGKGARVDTAGLLATTLGLSDADFMAGRARFTGSGGPVVNEGTLSARDGGYVALIGSQVKNDGVITARLGTVALASGNKVSLNFNGDALVGVTLEDGALEALVANGGAIRADGGLVLLTAKAAEGLLGGMVNNTGEVRAQTISEREGKIFLLGDMQSGTVKVGGTLDASAPQGGNGGFIETSAASVKVADDARVGTRSPVGRNGTWLIDPTDFNIVAGSGSQSGSGIGVTTLESALAAGNVTIQTQSAGSANGDINVNAPVSWNANLLTLEAHGDINVNAVMSASGTSTLDLKTGYSAGNYVDTSRRVRVGIAVDSNGAPSFPGRLDFTGDIDAATGYRSGGTPGLVVNGSSYRLITALGNQTDHLAAGNYTLQGLGHSSNLSGNFALAANIDAAPTSGWNSGQGFTPIGNYANFSSQFSGRMNGLGHTITGLSFTRSYPGYPIYGAEGQSLFGWADNGAQILNLGMLNVAISTGGTQYVGATTGGLVGFAGWNGRDTANGVVVANSFATGSISEAAGAGGLVGEGYNVRIENSYAKVNISTTKNGSGNVGGLIGSGEYVDIYRSYVGNAVLTGAQTVGGLAGKLRVGNTVARFSAVTESFSSATVIGSATGYSYQGNPTSAAIGGLVGGASGYTAITNSYATGSVTALAANVDGIGGLVGLFDGPNASVTNSYSTGLVTATTPICAGSVGCIGGFLGAYRSTFAPTVTNSFWDVDTSGIGSANSDTGSVGGTGKASADLKTLAVLTGAGWSASGTDGVYPTLTYAGSSGASTVWYLTPPVVSVTYSLINTNSGYSYSGSAYSLADLWSPTDIFGVSYNNWILGTDYTFAYGGNTVTSFTNAGTFSGIGINVLKTGFATASSGNAAGSFTIAPKTLTLSGAKVYDGSSTLTGAQVTLGGLIGSETLAYMGSTASSKNVGAGNFISVITLANGTNGGLASNYALPALDAANALASITARPVDLSTFSASAKVYDGTDLLDHEMVRLTNTVGGDVVTMAGQATLASANAGVRTLTGPGTLTLSDPNYTLVGGTVSGTANIYKLLLDLSTVSGAARAYDGGTQIDASMLQMNNVVSGDVVNLAGTARLAGKNVGDRAVTRIGDLSVDNPNYTLDEGMATGTVAITPRSLNLDFAVAPKVFDGSVAAVATSTDNRIAGDVLSANFTAAFGTTAAANGKPVTINGLSLAGTDAANYVPVAAAATGNITVRPITLTVSLQNPAQVLTATGQDLFTPATVDQLVSAAWANTVTDTAPGTPGYTIWLNGQQVAAIREAGTYEIRPGLAGVDASYQASVTGLAPTLVVQAAAPVPVSMPAPVTAVQLAIDRAIRTEPPVRSDIVASLGQAAPRSVAEFNPTAPNVVAVSPSLNAMFGTGANLRVISAPGGNELSQAVGLSQARGLMQSPQGGAAGSDRDLRVPVSRNSLAEIVNGGVKLPTGVDQLLFVVADAADQGAQDSQNSQRGQSAADGQASQSGTTRASGSQNSPAN
jgi:filamentous hemagglutinin family protein